MGLLEAVRKEIAERELEQAAHAEVIEVRSARIHTLNGEIEKLRGVEELAVSLAGDDEDDEPAVADPPRRQPPARSSAASTPTRKGPAAAGAAKTKASAEEAAATIAQVLGRRGDATQTELAEETGIKIGRVVSALEKIAERTGEKRGGGRGSPVWRLKNSEEGHKPPPVNAGTNGAATADEVLRARILEVLEAGPAQGPDLDEAVSDLAPDTRLMASCMRQLLEARKIERISRAGHVYYEAVEAE